MKLKVLALMSGILVLLAVAAFAVNRWMNEPQDQGRVGQTLMGTASPADARRIEIVTPEHKVTLDTTDGSTWTVAQQGEFPVEIRMGVANQRGALATVAAAIAEMDANIDNISLEERDGRFSTLTLVVEVHDRRHLARIMRRLRSIDLVARITRTRG